MRASDRVVVLDTAELGTVMAAPGRYRCSECGALHDDPHYLVKLDSNSNEHAYGYRADQLAPHTEEGAPTPCPR